MAVSRLDRAHCVPNSSNSLSSFAIRLTSSIVSGGIVVHPLFNSGWLTFSRRGLVSGLLMYELQKWKTISSNLLYRMVVLHSSQYPGAVCRMFELNPKCHHISSDWLVGGLCMFLLVIECINWLDKYDLWRHALVPTAWTNRLLELIPARKSGSINLIRLNEREAVGATRYIFPIQPWTKHGKYHT